MVTIINHTLYLTGIRLRLYFLMIDVVQIISKYSQK